MENSGSNESSVPDSTKIATVSHGLMPLNILDFTEGWEKYLGEKTWKFRTTRAK